MIPLSVLDLAPIVEGSNAAEALKNSLNLAQHAEKFGYNRYWVAEHDEVMECYLMTGDSDYLIRVVVPDIEALKRLFWNS